MTCCHGGQLVHSVGAFFAATYFEGKKVFAKP
jgi:hypothetical protein